MYISAYLFRLGLFTYRDQPVLFNRATREISFMPIKKPPFFRFWEPGGVHPARTLPWNTVQVRTYRGPNPAGGLITFLGLLWGEPGDPQCFADSVVIGDTSVGDDEAQWALWEHIRQYMEEGGPAIQPGEKLRKTALTHPLPEFPPDIIEAAGGPPLSQAEVAELADTELSNTATTGSG